MTNATVMPASTGSPRRPAGALASHRAGHDPVLARPATGLSVVVVDDEQALAEALAAALLDHDGVARAIAAGDAASAASAAERTDCDVVVVGLDSDQWDAVGFLRGVACRQPKAALIAMSADEDPDLVASALRAGAVSWVSKRVGVSDMASVITGAARGESSIPPGVLRQVLRRLAGDPAQPSRASVFADLTDREREILEYAVLGYKRGDIAAELGLSVNTVRTHVQHILSKLGVHTMLEAVTLVLREKALAD
jgi:DNA-binding NarL/FixJ family response regulator